METNRRNFVKKLAGVAGVVGAGTVGAIGGSYNEAVHARNEAAKNDQVSEIYVKQLDESLEATNEAIALLQAGKNDEALRILLKIQNLHPSKIK